MTSGPPSAGLHGSPGRRRDRTLLTSSRATRFPATPAAAFRTLASARPGPHWYADALPLRFRALLDVLLGGAGAAGEPSGRALLREGELVGFWRVLSCGRGPDGHRLLLEAEVRAPGRVRLETLVRPAGRGRDAGAVVSQEVRFDPAGLLGAAYLVADLPAREALVELVHRRALAEVRSALED
ncbi:DUF2867 domain-containing protein [Nocardioides sp. GY 10127]|uniref:DUF2867 domain-containing protein n=1 Tax=Nocardioides sp. GY 10127 TaxID=2569762 RepID=UPI0010A7C077|nr:DUF2867 domain-containing protein [Nocardioides sp. GY 10127]TIC80215.1 DUF2867 domain-containing protein [Nocardioides sp. GY 10127]